MAAPAVMMAAQVGIPLLMNALNKKKGGGGGEQQSPAAPAAPTTDTAMPGMASNIMPSGANPALAAGLGIGQLVQGHMQRKKADRLEPGLEDPQQVLAMQEYQRRANNAMTGAGVSNAMRDLQQSRAGAYRALARSGSAGQYGMLSRSLAQEGNAMLAQGQQQEQFYRGKFDKMLDTVADRRLRLQSKRADAMRQRSEANIAGGAQNALAGLSKMGKLGGGGGEGETTGGAGGGEGETTGGAGGVSPSMFGAQRSLPAGGTMGSYPGANMGSKIGGGLNLGETNPMNFMMGG